MSSCKSLLIGAKFSLMLMGAAASIFSQQPPPVTATLDNITRALNAAVFPSEHWAYARCQLNTAIWGSFGITVSIPQASTVNNQALLFIIQGGILYQQIDSSPSPNTRPTVTRNGANINSQAGDLFLPDRDAAFAKGVPFWIGDISESQSGDFTRVQYTVYSNPSTQGGAFDVFQAKVAPFQTNLTTYNHFVSSSQPRTLSGAIEGVPTPTGEDYLYAALGNSPLYCPVSNEVDLWAASVNTPVIRGHLPVLQAFDTVGIRPTISSGTWIQIYGEKFSTTTRSWGTSDFLGAQAPTSLDGVSVNVNGKAAFVSYVSPNQVNAQVPDDDTLGPVTVEVVNAKGKSNQVTVTKVANSTLLLTTPSFLANGKQYLTALFPDGVTFVGPENLIPGVPFRPAKPGDTITTYGVGCGATTPPAPSGQILARARPLATPYPFTFGQTPAQAQGFLAAEAVGLCQFNILVPDVPDGDVAINPPNVPAGVLVFGQLFTTVRR